MLSNAFKTCMVDLDVTRARALWAETSAHLPQPKNDFEMLVILHHARTQSEIIELKLRAYSHSWLLDHDLPSGLPDALRPAAERLYPRVAEAVGISVNFSAKELKPAAELIQGAMEDAVNEAFADGNKDPAFIQASMREARKRETFKLFGRLGAPAHG